MKSKIAVLIPCYNESKKNKKPKMMINVSQIAGIR